MSLKLKTATIMRGAKWSITHRVLSTGLDFTGADFSAQVRAKPDGDLLATAAVSATTTTVGRADITITLAGSITETLPGYCGLDLRVAHTARGFGPEFPLRVWLTIEGALTHSTETDYRFTRFELKGLDGAYRALTAGDDNQVGMTAPNGVSQYPTIDLRKPDGTYLGFTIDEDDQFKTKVPAGEVLMPYIELLKPSGGYLRIWVDSSDQVQVSVIPA